MTVHVSRTSASAGDVARAGSTHESKNEKIRLSTHSALRYSSADVENSGYLEKLIWEEWVCLPQRNVVTKTNFHIEREQEDKDDVSLEKWIRKEAGLHM